MSRLIADLTGWFGLGVIITEIPYNFNLFNFRLKVHFVAVPIVLIFLLSELILKHFKNKANSSIDDENKSQRIITTYSLFVGMKGEAMLPERLKQTYEEFFEATAKNEILDQKTTVMIQLAASFVMGCYP